MSWKGESVYGSCVQASAGEVWLRLQDGPVPPVDDEVSLRLQLDNGSPALSGAALVRWFDEGTRTVGLAMTESALGAGLRRWLETVRPTVVSFDDDAEHEAEYAALGKDFVHVRCRGRDEVWAALESRAVSVLLVGDGAPGVRPRPFLLETQERFAGRPTVYLLAREQTVVGHPEVAEGTPFVLRKPFTAEALTEIVRRAVDRAELAAENDRLQSELERVNRRLLRENRLLRQRLVGLEGFESIVGASPATARLLVEVQRIRGAEATVHLSGETGTGKELVARALHGGGNRRNGPFKALNCGGLTETLVHSELFGHRRGAFTGADRDHPGMFQQADGGTLFLDEVAELPAATQATLLRALQVREVVPLGATGPVPFDVQLISATNKDLRQEVQAGRFREDLYFRLVILTVELPPLRERTGDVPLLARHFLDVHCERLGRDVRGFTTEAMAMLEAYPWPGNVRELQNEIERLVVLTPDGQPIRPEQLSAHLNRKAEPAPVRETPGELPGSGGIAVPTHLGFDAAVDHLSRTMIERALREASGVVAHAAEKLGVERSRLSKLRDRLGLKP